MIQDIKNHDIRSLDIRKYALILNKLSKKNLNHIRHMNIKQPVLAIFDRGYPSMENQLTKQFFCGIPIID